MFLLAAQSTAASACPAEAIFSDSESAATSHWLDLNRKYSELWPNITGKKAPLPDADAQNGRPGKASEFSPLPGIDDEAKALAGE